LDEAFFATLLPVEVSYAKLLTALALPGAARCASWVQWRSVGGRGEWAVSWHLCGGWFYRVMIHFPKLPNCGFGKAGVRDDQTKSHGSCTIGTTGTGICETKMERCAEVVGNGHHQLEAAGPRNNQVGLEVGIW